MSNPITRLSRSIRKRVRLLSPSAGTVNYERYWQTARGSYSERFVDQVCETFQFHTVLDAGCGDGTVVRRFLERGKDARGIEFSHEATATHCPDLMQRGHIVNGSLTNLPFGDDAFDLVFSSEVLEHIPEVDVPRAVAELARVAREQLFITISLRPSSDNNKYHVTLKSREWWESAFHQCGCERKPTLVDLFQIRKQGASVREIMEAGPTAAIMDEIDWFINDPPFDLQGEFEPWFFIFGAKPAA